MKKVLVILMAAIFLLACYVPVYAADWDLYGSARVATFWTDYDEDHTGAFADTTQFVHDLQGTSRIGASVENGPIGGAFEYGAAGGNANIRLLYATFDIGPGQLLVGQTYVPFVMGSYISGQVYAGDSNMGEFIADMARRPMVRYSLDNFSFALVKPERVGFGAVDADDSEVLLPQIQARYHNMLADGIGFNIAGFYQTYELEDEAAAWDGESLDAWALSANMQFSQLDPLYFNMGGYYGQNINQAGVFYADRIGGAAELNAAADGVEDTSTYGLLFVAGTSVGEVGLEAGVGYVESDNDNWNNAGEMMGYYAHAKIPMIEGGNAYIIPEIGYYDWDNGANFNELYAGVQWRVDF